MVLGKFLSLCLILFLGFASGAGAQETAEPLPIKDLKHPLLHQNDPRLKMTAAFQLADAYPDTAAEEIRDAMSVEDWVRMGEQFFEKFREENVTRDNYLRDFREGLRLIDRLNSPRISILVNELPSYPVDGWDFRKVPALRLASQAARMLIRPDILVGSPVVESDSFPTKHGVGVQIYGKESNNFTSLYSDSAKAEGMDFTFFRRSDTGASILTREFNERFGTLEGGGYFSPFENAVRELLWGRSFYDRRLSTSGVFSLTDGRGISFAPDDVRTARLNGSLEHEGPYTDSLFQILLRDLRGRISPTSVALTALEQDHELALQRLQGTRANREPGGRLTDRSVGARSGVDRMARRAP